MIPPLLLAVNQRDASNYLNDHDNLFRGPLSVVVLLPHQWALEGRRVDEFHATGQALAHPKFASTEKVLLRSLAMSRRPSAVPQ